MNRLPLLPLALMGGARWNILEAGGCRIACCASEEMARNLLKAVNHVANMGETGTCTFDELLTHALLTGMLREDQAEYWKEGCILLNHAIRSVREHMEREGGEHPFNVFDCEKPSEYNLETI